MQRIAFDAPEKAGYAISKNVKFARIWDAPEIRIAMRMFAPKPDEDNFAQFTKQSLDGQKPLLLYSHGNGEDIGGIARDCAWLAEKLDMFLITYDYVNYGQSSPGVTGEQNLTEAIKAVHTFCLEHLRASRIILFGRSIGSAPTLALAAGTAQYSGVILMSAFASGVRTLAISRYLPKPVLMRLDGFFCPNLDKIKNVATPVLIIHGQQDQVVPVSNAYELLSMIPSRFRTEGLFLGSKCNPVGHNDILEKHGWDAVVRILAFMVELER